MLKRVRNWAVLSFLILAVVLAGVTWNLFLEYRATGIMTIRLVVTILCDVAMIFVFVVFAAYQALRKSLRISAVSTVRTPLHLRLLRIFSLVAIIPVIGTAVIGTLVMVTAVSDFIIGEVKRASDLASEAAISYVEEETVRQFTGIADLAAAVSGRIQIVPLLEDGLLRKELHDVQASVNHSLDHVFIVDGGGLLVARGRESFIFDCDTPAPAAVSMAGVQGSRTILFGNEPVECSQTGEMGEAFAFRCFLPATGAEIDCSAESADGLAVIYRQEGSNNLYSLIGLDGVQDRFLYGTVELNADILGLAIASEQGEPLANRLLAGILQWSSANILISLVLLLLLFVLAVRLARRLAQPVEELAGLADSLGRGERNVRIPDYVGGDEVAMLGRSFKDMVTRLDARRQEIEEQYIRADDDKRKFDSVLGAVSTGVIGLDSQERIVFANRAAERMLRRGLMGQDGAHSLREVVPEFTGLIDDLQANESSQEERKIEISKSDSRIQLHTKIALRRGQKGRDGFVLSFEDITELTKNEAARAKMDLAKDIAHNTRSPLNSAWTQASTIKEVLEDRVDSGEGNRVDVTLVKSISGLERNIVRVRELLRWFQKTDEQILAESGMHDVYRIIRRFSADAAARHPEIRINGLCADRSELHILVDQMEFLESLENLLSNAVDAINERSQSADNSYRGEIRLDVSETAEDVEIEIMDNGIGLPAERGRLTELGFSTHGEGRGEGLSIVGKFVQKHAGRVSLDDAPAFDGGEIRGAKAVISLPRKTGR
ncbi:MAG: ATP-binding protein [Rhodobacteraceae bacterium]|nr:ATP-binding protein [Paracoccaceae bacterium]